MAALVRDDPEAGREEADKERVERPDSEACCWVEERVGEREEEGGLGRGHRRIRPLEGAWAEEGDAWEA